MNQAFREKIAVVVFAIAVVGFFVAIISYQIAGHSWNIAARDIDEHRGAMEDYSAIVFYGIALPSSVKDQSEDSPVPITSVIRSYNDKGASVLRLDVLHPEIYEGDDIFYLGGHRIGVFYASAGMTIVDLRHRVDYFAQHQVDYTLCITDDISFLDLSPEGIDIAVVRNGSRELKTGQSDSGIFVAKSPVVGKIGAVLISPEEVISAKAISTIPTREDDEKANREAAQEDAEA